MQLIQGKKIFSSYKSEIWPNMEKNKDITKQKCQRVLKALKMLRY